MKKKLIIIIFNKIAFVSNLYVHIMPFNCNSYTKYIKALFIKNE